MVESARLTTHDTKQTQSDAISPLGLGPKIITICQYTYLSHCLTVYITVYIYIFIYISIYIYTPCSK